MITIIELLLVGLPHLDFKELEESTQYIGPGYWNSSLPLIKEFWGIVHSMSFEEKQKLLKFVTGTSLVFFIIMTTTIIVYYYCYYHNYYHYHHYYYHCYHCYHCYHYYYC